MRLNGIPRLVLCVSLLLTSLNVKSAQAQSYGPWTQQTNAPQAPLGSRSTNYVTLRTVAPTTVWGWTTTAYAGTNGSSAQLIVSANAGQSWQQATVSNETRTGANTYAGNVALDAWMTDDQHAWVITRDVTTNARTLKKTTTGLEGFSSAEAPADAQKIRFFSNSIGVIFKAPTSSSSTWNLYRTINGGTSWQPVLTALPYLANDAPTAIELLGNSLWAITESGRLLRTPDAGQTWSISTLPLNGKAASLAFRDASNGLLSQNEQLFRTSDAGQTWQVVTASGSRRNAGLVAVPNSVSTYLSFDGNCLPDCSSKGSAISTDNGLTWKELENSLFHTTLAASADGSMWSGTYSQANMYRASSAVLGSHKARPVEARFAFPNPAAGKLYFAAKPYARTISLLDATGRRHGFYQLSAEATTLDISACRPGLYVLTSTAQGQTQTQRLVLTAP